MSLAIDQSATIEGPQIMIQTASHTLTEILLAAAAVTLASAEIAIKTEAATADELLILWCVIGGFLGACCSLKFCPSKGGWDNAVQLAVNLILSAAFSPQICWTIAPWIGAPVGLRLAIPVSVAVGSFAQAVVFMLIPWGKKYLEARAAKVVDGDKTAPAP